jgi:low temperature requirement protein LtrA
VRGDYRPLAAAPQLHQDWNEPQDEQHSVTWPELFFDVFFVAAISNLSHLFEERPDAANAGGWMQYVVLMFFNPYECTSCTVVSSDSRPAPTAAAG